MSVDENLFCEEAECGKSAHTFGFIDEKKWKVCETHTLSLIRKQVTVYDIEALSFIETPTDGPLYEQRREWKRKGQESITLLESACESSWEEGQKRLQQACEAVHEVVQRSFQGMWESSHQCYEENKKKLRETHSRLERLVLDRNYEMTPSDSAICEGISAGPIFSVIVGDSQLPVAETLFPNFHLLTWNIANESQKDWGIRLQQFALDQAKNSRNDLALQVAEIANQLDVDLPDYQGAALQQTQETTRRLRYLCLSSAEKEAQECLKVGLEMGKAGRFEEALGELQRGRELVKDVDSVELYLQLSCGLAEVYCQAALWEDCILLCEHTLTACGSSPHHFELHQILFYLTIAYYSLDQEDKGYAAVDEWSGKLIAEASRTKCLLLRIQANRTRLQDQNEEAESLYEEALQLDQSQSYITICCLRQLADAYWALGKLEISEETYLNALELTSANFPKAYVYPCCKYQLGCFYKERNRLQEAETQLQQAKELYSAYFPYTAGYVYCLQSLGDLYEVMKKPLEAEQQLLQACQLCSVHFPQSDIYGICYIDLAIFYSHLDRVEEAEKQCSLATGFYSTYFPRDKKYVSCMYRLGVLYNSMKMSQEAIEQYEQAVQLCSNHFPTIQMHADCLLNLGNEYYCRNVKEEAEKRYVQAIEIYSTYFPKTKGYSLCLLNLGKAYQYLNRLDEAEQHFLWALVLFDSDFTGTREHAQCLHVLGEVYEDSGRGEEAAHNLEEARQLYVKLGALSDADDCDRALMSLRW